MSVRVEFRWSEDLLARVDAAASFESRASWVRRAVERALDGSQQDVALRGAASGETPAGSPPAPAEQPEQPSVRQAVSVPALAKQFDAEPPVIAELRAEELRRVSPPKPIPPRVPFRRDVKPFQRGDK